MVSAQGLINSGAYIVVNGAGQIYINEGGWTNDGTFTSGTSTVTFGGATAQSIAGSNSTPFYSIIANGAGTKTFSTSTSTLSNLLTLGSGTTVAAGGRLTLLATATTNANVAAIPSNASVTGNVNVQVYFTGGTDAYRGTRAISSPVTEAVSTTYSQLKNYMVITGTNGGGFDPGGAAQPYATSLTRYNESATIAQSQFTPVTNITQALSAGNGAFLFFRGDRTNYTSGTALTSNKVNTPFSTPENVTMQYTGPINQQDVVVAVPRTNNGEATYDGYILLGNPYPAVIDWGNVTKSNMSTDFRIVKPTGGFITYLSGVLAGNSGWSGDVFHIMPGQAFYARANAGGGTVTFTESAKSLSTAPVRLMSSPKESPFQNSISSLNPKTNAFFHQNKELRITLQNNTHVEEAVTVFKTGSNSLALDEDAALFGGSSITLSTLSSDSVRLTINFMPELREVQELRLSLNAAASGPVKLNFTDLSATANHEVILQDAFTQTETKVTADNSYGFEINKANPLTFGDKRFKLVFKPLLSSVEFIANKIAIGAELKWLTANEGYYGNFEIERSEDGINFKSIGKVDFLSSKNSYSFIDRDPVWGTNYYRLKQVDAKGDVKLSDPISLNYTLDKDHKFEVYPNPAKDYVSVEYSGRNKSVELYVLDLQGRELTRNVFTKDQIIRQTVRELPSGVYVLQLKDQGTNSVIIATKFIKE
ncbi:MAG: T9SS type A sorting domain-containing protein [Sphingobacteriaceae bacterium]|nr:T9SS type A sorting domain-containing protein [Sphingobacteriaceae bacterium]